MVKENKKLTQKALKVGSINFTKVYINENKKLIQKALKVGLIINFTKVFPHLNSMIVFIVSVTEDGHLFPFKITCNFRFSESSVMTSSKDE